MKTTIVITSINEPTEAVQAFAKLPDYHLVVVGDKKTPKSWRWENTTFLAVDDPSTAALSLSGALPFNHYCRKMLGYLHAVRSKSDAIVDTDDDNIPKGGWTFPTFDGSFEQISGPAGFVNIYRYYSDMHIWPRGLPLRLINDKTPLRTPAAVAGLRVGVWQGLADEDPDVDAIYRLTSDVPCNFQDRAPLVLDRDVATPYNSQNTLYRRELFPLLYLPATVTFRFTDILRSLVAQPIMWAHGYRLGFTNATVVQKRNPHDYFKDFISEIPMYEHGERVIGLVRDTVSASRTVAENLRTAYGVLQTNGIVKDDELRILDCWLNDLRALGS